MEIKIARYEWGAMGRAGRTANIVKEKAAVEHLHEMSLGTLFLSLTGMLSGSYHFPVL